MTTNRFLDALNNTAAPLVLDGATGTNLQARGLTRGAPGETWVLDNPQEILRLHRDFLTAGSNIILTCTFGATGLRLAHLGLADRAAEVNQKAAALAREAAAPFGALVAGSIGPTGQMLKPLGPLEPAEAEAAFTAQAQSLAAAGVDLLVVETQFDLAEAELAVRAALSTGLPVVCSFSYDRGVRTMMGVKPGQMAEKFGAMGAAALGINCGRSLEENLKVLADLRAVTALPVWFKPNAGMPLTDEQGQTHYSLTPAEMGAQAPGWVAAGARLVGGCCGTSPEHLAAIAQAVKA